MARVAKTWEDSVAKFLRNDFGWSEAEAYAVTGIISTLPNRNTFNYRFLAAAFELRARIGLDKIKSLLDIAASNNQYPSRIIPSLQKNKEFPARAKLEKIIEEIVGKISLAKLDVENPTLLAVERIKYLREKAEVADYFLTILDFEALGSQVPAGEEAEEEESEAEEIESESE
jgi:hypothetical protein